MRRGASRRRQSEEHRAWQEQRGYGEAIEGMWKAQQQGCTRWPSTMWRARPARIALFTAASPAAHRF